MSILFLIYSMSNRQCAAGTGSKTDAPGENMFPEHKQAPFKY